MMALKISRKTALVAAVATAAAVQELRYAETQASFARLAGAARTETQS
jgi:hypothetical protein